MLTTYFFPIDKNAFQRSLIDRTMYEFLRFFQERGLRAGILAGNPESIEALFERYADKMFLYALSFLGSEDSAGEVVQSCFLALVRKPEVLMKVKSLRAYLYAMVRNESIDCLKRRAHEVPLDDYEKGIYAGSPDPEGMFIEQMVNELPPEQREVVLLKIYQDLTFREISEIVGAPQNTVASRYRYALGQMRIRLEEQ